MALKTLLNPRRIALLLVRLRKMSDQVTQRSERLDKCALSNRRMGQKILR